MCYCLFFSIKLHEAVDLLNSLIDEDENAQEEVAAVYIQPPDPAYDSADYLKKLGHNGTGTIRENRVPANKRLRSNIYMNKAERGSMCTATMSDLGICITK